MDIGIDLGTTFSVIAVNGGIDVAPDYSGGAGVYLKECDVTVIPSPYGEQTFPSVVMQDPDDLSRYLFGTEALQWAEQGIPPVMFSKRKIGTREEIPMQTKTLIARDVAREFIKYLKQCAEQALGQPVDRAVVTHPAYFDRNAVEETREAAIAAGFDMSLPEQMVMEPVAAALCYTRTDFRDPLRVLTYDLGGGTFDVTYMERREGVIQMRAFDGDHLLGGYNFDRELAHWIRKRLEERGRAISFDETNPDDRGRLLQLLRLAERVKIELSQARTDTTTVEIRARDILVDMEGRPIQINERITRQEFVLLIQPHLEKASACCIRALKKAGVTPAEIDEVLLVGGSTYGPWVAGELRRCFPEVNPKLFNPDLCVGAGAAIHAKMVLPAIINSERYSLTLDVPDTSVLDVINISGLVSPSPESACLFATLTAQSGVSRPPVAVEGAGRFLIEGVELAEGANEFLISVGAAARVPDLRHRFCVAYAPAAAETSGVVTVLPRPLYIETTDGLAPLAEEGLALPAKCSRVFERTNDNPNITLRLFQEEYPIGEVRILNIPREGGRGSLVDLTIEVTEKNQIRGKAIVCARSGKVLAETAVEVHFTTPEINDVGALRNAFEAIKDAIMFPGRLPSHIQDETERIVNEIEHLFEQQPLEAQEIHVALQRLLKLTSPPEDPMKPTLNVFLEIAHRCRANLDARVAYARESAATSGPDGNGQRLDPKAREVAKDTLARSKNYLAALDRLEQDGIAAHNRKDQQTWSRLYDALVSLEGQLQERKQHETLPTAVNKVLASFSLMQIAQQLEDKAAEIDTRRDSSDWQHEISRLRQDIREALHSIQSIDANLSPGQGRAQVRHIFARLITPIERAITQLGTDIRATRGRN